MKQKPYDRGEKLSTRSTSTTPPNYLLPGLLRLRPSERYGMLSSRWRTNAKRELTYSRH